MNKTEIKKFKINSIYSGINLFIKLFINVFIFIVIARVNFVSVVEFGILTYAISVGMIFILLADYGIETYAIRDIAGGIIKESEYKYIFSFRVFLSIISFLLFLIYCTISDANNFTFIVMIVLAYFIGFLSRTIQLFFQGNEKFKTETKARFFEDSIFLLFVMSNILYFKDFELFAVLFFISRFIGFVFNYFLFKKVFGFHLQLSFKISNIKKLFYNAFSFALLSILPTFMINIDTIMIRNLLTQEINFINTQIAYYSASAKIFVIFTFIASIFQKALLPQLSRLKKNTQLFLSSIYTLNNAMFNFNLISSIFIFYYAKNIILLLYSDKYIEATPFLQLISIIVILRTTVAYGLYFTILDHLRVRIFSSLILFISFITLSFYFIPKFNGIGALYAILFAYMVDWSYVLYKTFKIHGNVFLGLNKIFIFVNGLLFFVLIRILDLNFFLAIIFTAFYLLCVFIIFRKNIEKLIL